MRIAILVSALAALAAAFPYPQDQENPDGPDDEPSDDPETSADSFATRTVPVQLSTSLNIPITGSVALPTLVPGYDTTSTSRRNPHWEPIPIFTKACTCDVATVRYPCWATDSLQVSESVPIYETRSERSDTIPVPANNSNPSNSDATTKKTSPTAATWLQQADVPHQLES
jgi:hypothetical protein